MESFVVLGAEQVTVKCRLFNPDLLPDQDMVTWPCGTLS